MDTQTDIQKRYTDRQTEKRHNDAYIDGQNDKWTHEAMDKQIQRHTDTHTNTRSQRKNIHRYTDRHTNRLAEKRHVDTHTDEQINT